MNEDKLRYILYARKSSESEDKQVQSIEDQTMVLRKLAKRLNLKVVKEMGEAKSAKQPNTRPVFSEMMEIIQNGEADAILCWQINRLSRNPVDSGLINWYLQEGILKRIRTNDREYNTGDNVLLLTVEAGVANQFIIDLRKNTKRGMERKLEKGWYPALAPIGYLNTPFLLQGDKKIVIDKERFYIVRKLWDYMLTGKYTVPALVKIADEQLGLTTRKRKKIGGKPFSKSALHKMFTNPFYTGLFEYGGKTYEGKHKPMVTMDEFDRVQEILGSKAKPRKHTHDFSFTGIVVCGECGGMMTAETKRKWVKSEGKYHYYTYYHCSHNKKGKKCNQKGAVRKTYIEKEIRERLKKITIKPEFLEWALKIIERENAKEGEDFNLIADNLDKNIKGLENERRNLIAMRCKEMVSDEEFGEIKGDLDIRITRKRKEREQLEKRADDWVELSEKTFKFATYAYYHFNNGSIELKRDIFRSLGYAFELMDKELTFNTNKWLVKIEKDYPSLENQYNQVITKKYANISERNRDVQAIFSMWGE